MMDRTLKALSLTLSYPTAELQGAMPDIGDVLDLIPVSGRTHERLCRR